MGWDHYIHLMIAINSLLLAINAAYHVWTTHKHRHQVLAAAAAAAQSSGCKA